MNLMEEFLKDSVATPKDNELKEIAQLANDQRHWEKQIATLEYELEQAKEALRQIQEFLLPEAMATAGLMEFKLVDGSKIAIKDDVYASIRKDRIGEAVAWLDSVGIGDIVKDKIDVNFGRGEADLARSFMDFCRQNGYNASESLSVHPQTLKATVKEQLAKGVQFPDEFFSIQPVRKAIIKGK